MIEYDFGTLLETLQNAGVEFILVGGLSAALHGVPVQTFDVDVVHRRTPENVDRLLPLLQDLDAIYRFQSARRLQPGRSALLSSGHQNLLTRNGPLDLLGAIGDGLGYEELLPRSTVVSIAPGVGIRVLNLETLIELKEQLGGEKDRAMLPLLRRTLERKGR
jgi:predicted nucleotidyltransferase